MRLHEALDAGSRGLALLTYQFATLQFIRGLLAEAQELGGRSLALAEAAFASEPDQARGWRCVLAINIAVAC